MGSKTSESPTDGGVTPAPEPSVQQDAKATRLRELLDDVAAGRVSPARAGELLADISGGSPKDSAAAAAQPAAGSASGSPSGDVWADVSDQTVSRPPTDSTESHAAKPGPGKEPAVSSARRVVIRAVGRRVKVIGEPSVTTVSVDGPHVVRRDGDTVSVNSEGELGASVDGFTLMRSRSLEDIRDTLLGLRRELAVRVNPGLEVEIEVTAGGLTVERVPHLSQVRVTAGSAKLVDADGPLDLLVQAGSARVDMSPTTGKSRLRVESGSLDVRLGDRADVRVRTDAQLGKVVWHGSQHQGSAEEVTVGAGSAVLDLEVVMGSVQVRAR
jgi:hypothetical protein